MPVQQIILLRHGHRLPWLFDPQTRTYTSALPFPTGLPADPPLASHGVRQAHETATHLRTLLAAEAQSDRLRLYSSLFFRCLQTLGPAVEALRGIGGWAGTVRGERGVGEWFGRAPFAQPVAGEVGRLREGWFPWLDGRRRESLVVPERGGESIDELHRRVARAVGGIVAEVEREFEGAGRGAEEVTVLICGHAAGIIATGRVLTGRCPGDWREEEFGCFTCGLSRFVRRGGKSRAVGEDGEQELGDWKINGGVAGGWDCVLNSSCEHLSQGEERGWHFSGEENFDSYGPGQGSDTEGKEKQRVEDTNEEPPEGGKL